MSTVIIVVYVFLNKLKIITLLNVIQNDYYKLYSYF